MGPTASVPVDPRGVSDSRSQCCPTGSRLLEHRSDLLAIHPQRRLQRLDVLLPELGRSLDADAGAKAKQPVALVDVALHGSQRQIDLHGIGMGIGWGAGLPIKRLLQ